MGSGQDYEYPGSLILGAECPEGEEKGEKGSLGVREKGSYFNGNSTGA